MIRSTLAVLLVAAALTAGHQEAQARTVAPFRALQANIAGGPMNLGYRTTTAAHPRVDGTSALDTLNAQVEAFRPDVVMAEEVCATQRDLFATQHPDWTVAYVPMRLDHPACGGIPQGQMLASPWPMSAPIAVPLGYDDGSKVFTLLCADLATPGGTVRACATHLRAQGTDEAIDARIHQAATIAARVRTWKSQGRRVVIGGDFNTGPRTDAMDPLYAAMREADETDPRYCPDGPCRSGQPTINAAKYDYLFYSAAPTVSAGVIESAVSDHRLLRGVG